jgi:hypothetical protein
MLRSITDNSRRVDITFHRDGRIDINAHVARMLGLQEGDVIDIATDGVEYYMYVRYQAARTVGRHRGRCYVTHRGKRRQNNLRAYNVALTRAMLRGRNADAVSLPVGEAVETAELGLALPIITRAGA